MGISRQIFNRRSGVKVHIALPAWEATQSIKINAPKIPVM